MDIEHISDNVYANVTYSGGNVTCINTKEGMILVDTPTQKRDIDHWKRFISELNPKGVKYIINTHVHFDHIMGNKRLGGIVIMHERTRKGLFQKGVTLREMSRQMPVYAPDEVDFILTEELIPSQITMQDQLTVYLGDISLELRHIGGHTPDSILVYVPKDKVLITGDNLTSNLHPYKGHACFSEWITALKHMKTYEIEKAVPGHGEVCGEAAVDRLIAYFQKLWDLTAGHIAEGHGIEIAVQSVREKMFDFFEVDPAMRKWAQMGFDMGTERLYKEIAGASPSPKF